MAKAKKPSGCPIADAVAEIEKMNQDLDKQLAKDEAICKKQLEAAKKKMKKLAEAKSKAAAKKKAATAKAKAKPTAANKSQVEKAKAAIAKADEALVEVKEEITGLNHMLTKCSKFIKRRALEAKLLEKFRKDEAKKEALKLKNKSKPKPKKKVAQKAVVNTESAPSAPTTEENQVS
jgi:histone H1/5